MDDGRWKMRQGNTGHSALSQERSDGSSAPITEIAVIGLSTIVLFAALIWLAGLAGVEETPESVGSSLNEGPGGALALYRWLEGAGLQVRRVEARAELP